MDKNYEDDLREVADKARELFVLSNDVMQLYENIGGREWRLFYQVFRLAHVAMNICEDEVKLLRDTAPENMPEEW